MIAAEPYVFSASQVSTYEMCPRKWAWNKIDGLPVPSNAAADAGRQVHLCIENWLKLKKLPAKDEVTALAIIRHLPPPQAVDPAFVEMAFTWVCDDVPFRGFIDLVHCDLNQAVPITVYDHKTTSNLRWAKGPDELKSDVQATLYARVLMDQMATDTVELQWTYGTRAARPDVRPVRLTVTREQIEPRVDKTVTSAREMQAILASNCGAIDVPFDASACDAFGGCPFRKNCNLTQQQTQQQKEKTMTQEIQKNSFLQRLQARKAGTPMEPIVAPPVAINPPVATGSFIQSNPSNALVWPPVAVNPPETTGRHVPGSPVSLFGGNGAETVPVKRGPGRPRKDAESPNTAAPVAAPIAPVAAPIAPVAAPIAPVGAGWTLYLDCLPVKGAAAEHVSERLARVLLEYTAETGQSHYKLADYGKGPALFSEGFAKDLAANPPKNGILANTASQEVRDVLQVLMASATNIVQG